MGDALYSVCTGSRDSGTHTLIVSLRMSRGPGPAGPARPPLWCIQNASTGIAAASPIRASASATSREPAAVPHWQEDAPYRCAGQPLVGDYRGIPGAGKKVGEGLLLRVDAGGGLGWYADLGCAPATVHAVSDETSHPEADQQ